jgi:hypothetical protein
MQLVAVAFIMPSGTSMIAGVVVPYYLVGAAIAATIVFCGRTSGCAPYLCSSCL